MGQPCDIFAIGVILFNLLTGYIPFKEASKGDKLYELIMDANFDSFWKNHEKASKHSKSVLEKNVNLKNLIEKMIDSDAGFRMTASEIKKHPWYNGLFIEETNLFESMHFRYRTMCELRRKDKHLKNPKVTRTLKCINYNQIDTNVTSNRFMNLIQTSLPRGQFGKGSPVIKRQSSQTQDSWKQPRPSDTLDTPVFDQLDQSQISQISQMSQQSGGSRDISIQRRSRSYNSNRIEFSESASGRDIPGAKQTTIWNPLVVILCIYYNVKHSGNKAKNLKCVTNDYEKVISTFCDTWNYYAFFKTNDNKNRYVSKDTKLYEKYETNFKTNWSYNEIYSFNIDIKNQLAKGNHDSLIYIISSHCDKRGAVIYDSNMKKIYLTSIYEYFFYKQCKFLGDNPKIFCINAQFNSKVAAALVKKKKKKLKFSDPKGKSKIGSNSGSTSGSGGNGSGDELKEDLGYDSAYEKDGGFERVSTMMNLMLSEQNCRYIIGNSKVYGGDGTVNGGYLIESLTYFMKNKKFVENTNFDQIVTQMKMRVNQMLGSNQTGGTTSNVTSPVISFQIGPMKGHQIGASNTSATLSNTATPNLNAMGSSTAASASSSYGDDEDDDDFDEFITDTNLFDYELTFQARFNLTTFDEDENENETENDNTDQKNDVM